MLAAFRVKAVLAYPTWAHERSADCYEAVRQSLGEPDAFRMQHRSELREVVRSIVREGMNKNQATAHIAEWAAKNDQQPDPDEFVETAKGDVLGLHEGNFARYQIRPSEFQAWQKVWSTP